MNKPTFFTLVTDFFTKHLAAERNASPHTVAAYRDAFKLLIRFAGDACAVNASSIETEHLSPHLILCFLDSLECGRKNSIRTRNARLAAVKSFFRYVLIRAPELAALAQRVLLISGKRGQRRVMEYLTESEMDALLQHVDRATRLGQRDYLLLALIYDSGTRIQEVLDVAPKDFRLTTPALVRVVGKGRKERICPLMPETAKVVRRYLEATGLREDDVNPLFRNKDGGRLGRHGARYILRKYLKLAAQKMPSLGRAKISPHTLRHAKAMHLLTAGTPLVTIKDILGHADVRSTQIYVTSDLEAKRKALEAVGTPTTPGRAKPRMRQDVLKWLESL